MNRLKEKFKGENIKIIHQDFFEHKGKYDLVLEQTFFCALDPAKRKDYVEKMYELITPKGKLAGVLFDREFEGGPPFGGRKNEYENLFKTKFKIELIHLQVYADNPAVHLYKRFGFNEFGRQAAWIKEKGEYVARVFMERYLK